MPHSPSAVALVWMVEGGKDSSGERVVISLIRLRGLLLGFPLDRGPRSISDPAVDPTLPQKATLTLPTLSLISS